MEYIWFSARVFRFLTLSETHDWCPGCLNAPVSIALLPNICCQTGSFLVRCRAEWLQDSTDSGGGNGVGQEEILQGAESAQKHICSGLGNSFRKEMAGNNSVLIRV